MNDQKGLAPIIIIILIIIVLAGGILAWQYLGVTEEKAKLPEEKISEEKEEVVPEEKTADWKTYRNEEYGYEIAYPNNHIVEEERTSPIPEEEYPYAVYYEFWLPIQLLSTVKIYYPDIVSYPPEEAEKAKGVSMEINVYDNANNLSLDGWINYLENPPDVGNPIERWHGDFIDYKRPIFVAGIQGIEGKHEGCCLGCTRGIFIPKGNQIYNLDLQGGLGCEEGTFYCCLGEEEIFNQMLSTFRFLE